MGYQLSLDAMNAVMRALSQDYVVYAPKRMRDGSRHSDAPMVRYGEVLCAEEIVFDKKSEYSFKEVLLPITQTLFFFTEDTVSEPAMPTKGAVIFLRSCDMHSIRMLEQMYLGNGFVDDYYARLKQRVKFVLIGCPESFDNCFCVDMACNRTDDYDCYVEPRDGAYCVNNREASWEALFASHSTKAMDVSPAYVTQTNERVHIASNLTPEVAKSHIWDEYDSRCINCGRCNFVCPTCTCFTMQDIFYTDNGKVGERRRVWASCMVDGFTDVAGGHQYRPKNGQRMRFRTLHKIYDFQKRFGYHMCTGCGRCSDICPEYISFSACINQLEHAMQEVTEDAQK